MVTVTEIRNSNGVLTKMSGHKIGKAFDFASGIVAAAAVVGLVLAFVDVSIGAGLGFSVADLFIAGAVAAIAIFTRAIGIWFFRLTGVLPPKRARTRRNSKG